MRDHPEDCSFEKFYQGVLARNYRDVAEVKKDCTWLMRNIIPCKCPQILNFNKNTYWKLRKQWRQLLRPFIIDEVYQQPALDENEQDQPVLGAITPEFKAIKTAFLDKVVNHVLVTDYHEEDGNC